MTIKERLNKELSYVDYLAYNREYKIHDNDKSGLDYYKKNIKTK